MPDPSRRGFEERAQKPWTASQGAGELPVAGRAGRLARGRGIPLGDAPDGRPKSTFGGWAWQGLPIGISFVARSSDVIGLVMAEFGMRVCGLKSLGMYV